MNLNEIQSALIVLVWLGLLSLAFWGPSWEAIFTIVGAIVLNAVITWQRLKDLR